MKIDFSTVLVEAIKSERDVSQAKKGEVKVPLLGKGDRIANIKWHRETKFKKMKEDSFFFLEPDEGFFISYKPSDNYYLESNASFSFIIGAGPRRDLKHRWERAPYSFDIIDHPGKGYGTDPKFRVMKRTKKIFLEKIFGGDTGSKLKAQTMKDPLEYTDALKIAIKEHPELENYKFVPMKIKVKEFLETGPESLEAGGEQFVYAPVIGEKAKEIIEKEQYTGEVYFDKKVAKEHLKHLQSKDLYGVKAVVQMKAKGSEGFKDKEFGNYKFDGKIEPKSAKVVITNFSKFFDKDFKPSKEIDKTRYENIILNKPRGGKLGYWDKFIIAKDEEEWNYFSIERRKEEKSRTVNGRRRRPDPTLTQWSILPYVAEVRLKNEITILMFKPNTSQDQIDKFISYLWLKNKYAVNYINWKDPAREKMVETAYNIIFKHEYPDSFKYTFIGKSFGSEFDRDRVEEICSPPEVK